MVYQSALGPPAVRVTHALTLGDLAAGAVVFAEVPWPGHAPPEGKLRVWELIEVIA